MTKEESEKILLEIKKGKSLISRFQEEEWRITYEDEKFIYNYQSFESDGTEKVLLEAWSEEKMKSFLGMYSFSTMSSRIY